MKSAEKTMDIIHNFGREKKENGGLSPNINRSGRSPNINSTGLSPKVRIDFLVKKGGKTIFSRVFFFLNV